MEGGAQQKAPNSEVKRTVTVAVNGAYADRRSDVERAPHLLLKLHQLPEGEVSLRGRDLVLRETEANVILDYIKNVLPASAAR